jgi:hypothetical protein
MVPQFQTHILSRRPFYLNNLTPGMQRYTQSTQSLAAGSLQCLWLTVSTHNVINLRPRTRVFATSMFFWEKGSISPLRTPSAYTSPLKGEELFTNLACTAS